MVVLTHEREKVQFQLRQNKHQSTGGWLKPVVRVLKNLRSKLVDRGKIEPGDAPSYYLEGLLYHVPDEMLGSSYASSLSKSIHWIFQTDKPQLLCANEQYYLLRSGLHTCWDPAKCDKFVAAAAELWDGW